MKDEKATKVLDYTIQGGEKQYVNITSDLSALYEIIRSNPDTKLRRNSATHLLKLVEDGKYIDSDEILELFSAEKDAGVAAELKRVLNKLKMRQVFMEDPTTKYDRKLTPVEELNVLHEIDRLRKLYDKVAGDKGAFEKRYRIIEKIADGGMGRIYKGIRREDGAPVAIKFLLVDDLSKNNDREKIIARFKREGELLTKKLRHPSIVEAFECGEAGGEYFLVMEYIEGETLEDILKKGPLDFTTFKAISLQLCDTVEYIHKQEVIHRDIKPGNILIIEQHDLLRIKLCDFGLAKDKRDRKLSRISFYAGTDEYSSPQQLQDARDADERDDIFSMGKTFYEMFTGRTFKNDEPYIEISNFNSAVSGDFDALVKKCIDYEKKNRFQNISELRMSLEKILNGRAG